jgi:glycosyltransferase involved in cell wall biosynthesis
MGTLQPRKNIPFLIEAFARTKDNLGGIKLVICGNRAARNFDKRIDNAVKENHLEKEVVFPGYIDENDKQAVFKLAHVFVFPSLYEGFGIPVLEAMSQRVPVLASDIPSLKEIAQNGAIFFDVSSVDDLSKKIQEICLGSDIREKFIDLGLERVAFFSWQNSARGMLAIYSKLYHN